MKKLIYILCLLLLLSACKKTNQENQTQNNSTNSINTQTNKDLEENNLYIDKSSEKILNFEGANNEYSAKVVVSTFSKEDLEKFKNEDQVLYEELLEKLPSHKLETYISYIGDGIDDIGDEEEISFSLLYDQKYEKDFKYNDKKFIIDSLSGRENVTPKYFFYELDSDMPIPTKSSTMELKLFTSPNKLVNVKLELEYTD